MPTSPAPRAAQPATEVRTARRRRLLLVEDHAMVRDGLRRLLESPTTAPWQVVDVESAEQALDLLSREVFDLLVTDLTMPGLGGIELLGRLTRLPAPPPSLVLSMHDDAGHVRRAVEAGARGYVSKGSRSAELLEAVERVAAGGTYLPPMAARPPATGSPKAAAEPAVSRSPAGLSSEHAACSRVR